MSKAATIILLDISSSMRTEIREWRDHVTSLILSKIIENRASDSLGIIYINSSLTENNLSTDEDYLCIQVKAPLSKAQIFHLNSCINTFNFPAPPVDHFADYLDGIVVAADEIIRLTDGKKYGEKRVILVSDLSTPNEINMNGVQDIESRLKSCGITFELHQVNCAKSNKTNVEHLSGLTERLGGKVIQIDPCEGLNIASKKVRQTAGFKGTLSLAENSFQIEVAVYPKTMNSKLMTASRIAWNDTNNKPVDVKLERSIVYVASKENIAGTEPVGEAISEEDKEEKLIGDRGALNKAYRYGKTLVPFTEIDEENLSLTTTKDFSIVGFFARNELSHHLSMGNVHVCSSAETEPDEMKMKCLVRVLRKKEVGVLARQVSKDGNSPKIFGLLPHSEDGIECLIMFQLPFAEDVRRYPFNSINPDKLPLQMRPSEGQLELMSQFIDSMELDEKVFDPLSVRNPAFQRQIQSAIYRLQNPVEPLPPFDEGLLSDFSTPEQVLEKATNYFENIRNAFPLRVPNKKNKLDFIHLWSGNQNVPSESVDAVKKTQDKKDDDTLSKIRREHIFEDFNRMVTDRHQDLVSNAMYQLMALILDLSKHDSDLKTAVKAVEILRETAIKEDEHDMFNEFLTDMKNSRFMAPDNFPTALWEGMKAERLTLISVNDNKESTISVEDAELFLD